MLETYAPINFSILLKHVDWDKFPFTELHYVWLHPNQKIYFGELWPEQYWYETKKETLFTPPGLFHKRIREIIRQ
jgi:hypothetical protein